MPNPFNEFMRGIVEYTIRQRKKDGEIRESPQLEDYETHREEDDSYEVGE